MVRTYKRKRPQRASFEVLQLAAEEVIAKKKSLRAVAMSYDIDKMTLLRFCKKVKDGVPYKSGYSHHKLFFTEAEEHELVNYLLDAAKMFFGLSPNETRKLAFEYAKILPKKYSRFLACQFICRARLVQGIYEKAKKYPVHKNS